MYYVRMIVNVNGKEAVLLDGPLPYFLAECVLTLVAARGATDDGVRVFRAKIISETEAAAL